MSWTTPWSNAVLHQSIGQHKERLTDETSSAGLAFATAETRLRTTEWSATITNRPLARLG